MGLTHSPKIVTNGLVLCLDAGNTKSYPGSGTAWNDLTNIGSRNAALINSPTYSTNNLGYFTFNGSNTFASITKPNPNITGLISVEMWINFASGTGSVPIMKGTHFALNISSAQWAWGDSSNYSFANFVQRPISNLYTINQWNHFVITKDSSFNVNLYKNGQLIDSRLAFGGNLTAVTSTMWLGGYSDNDGNPSSAQLNGNLSAVRIYNSTLSAAEIKQNFNALRGRFGI